MTNKELAAQIARKPSLRDVLTAVREGFSNMNVGNTK